MTPDEPTYEEQQAQIDDLEKQIDQVSVSLFATKTFWSAIFTPIVGWIAAHYFTRLTSAQIDDFVSFLSLVSTVFILIRLRTKKPVHILAPKKEN